MKTHLRYYSINSLTCCIKETKSLASEVEKADMEYICCRINTFSQPRRQQWSWAVLSPLKTCSASATSTAFQAATTGGSGTQTVFANFLLLWQNPFLSSICWEWPAIERWFGKVFGMGTLISPYEWWLGISWDKVKPWGWGMGIAPRGKGHPNTPWKKGACGDRMRMAGMPLPLKHTGWGVRWGRD